MVRGADIKIKGMCNHLFPFLKHVTIIMRCSSWWSFRSLSKILSDEAEPFTNRLFSYLGILHKTLYKNEFQCLS